MDGWTTTTRGTKIHLNWKKSPKVNHFCLPKLHQNWEMFGFENHFDPLRSIKMTVPGVFPINVQFIKLYKSCEFMLTGLWTWLWHIVYPCSFKLEVKKLILCQMLIALANRVPRILLYLMLFVMYLIQTETAKLGERRISHNAVPCIPSWIATTYKH